MLCLSRRIGQRIVCIVPPSDQEQRIVFELASRRSGGTINVSVDAPREILIRREEVQAAIEAGDLKGVML